MSTFAGSVLSKQPTNDLLDVTKKLIEEKWDTVAKTGYTVIDLMELADRIPKGSEKEFGVARDQLNLVKLLKAPATLLENFNKLRRTVADFFENPKRKDLIQILRQGNDCIGPVNDTVDFLSKAILHIPKSTPWVKTLSGIDGGALALGMGWSVIDDLNYLDNSKFRTLTNKAERTTEFHEITKKMLNIAKAICLVALGCLTVLSVFFGFVFSPTIFIVLSATSLFFSLVTFYHKNYNITRDEK
jgi:hypothetical protein